MIVFNRKPKAPQKTKNTPSAPITEEIAPITEEIAQADWDRRNNEYWRLEEKCKRCGVSRRRHNGYNGQCLLFKEISAKSLEGEKL